MPFLGKGLGYAQLILSHGKSNKKRTFLTLVGLVIGITAIVALVSLGLGMQEYVDRQFQSLGSNKFFVMPGGGLSASITSNSLLTDADMTAVKRARGVKAVSPIIAKSASVSIGGSFNTQTFVLGLDTSADTREIFLETSTFSLDVGREFNIGERGKVMIGWGAFHGKYAFDNKPVSIGQMIYINGQPFRVIGVIARQGNAYDDSQVYISIDDAKELFKTNNYYEAIAMADNGYPVELAAENAKKKLRTLHDVKAGEEDFTVMTPEQLLETFNSVIGIIGYIVAGIAVISLVVGGIGIMNTMYTSVLERTTEIGIMKAVGATSRDILAIFILESGFLGFVGGAIGVILGSALAILAEKIISSEGIPGFTAAISADLLVGGLAFAFLVGTISGVLPARRAASLQPVAAMRGY